METIRIDEELKKQKVPPNPVKTNRYSKDSGVVDIELLKLGENGGHRLSAPECERLKKTTLSNSLIDISEGIQHRLFVELFVCFWWIFKRAQNWWGEQHASPLIMTLIFS